MTPEDQARREWDEGKKWADSLTTEVSINLDDARRIHLLIEDSLESAWEHLRDEAEEILKTTPDDPHAQETLRDYRDYKRKIAMPDAKRLGLILTKPGSRGRKVTLSKTASWVRDKKYGWLVRSAGEIGDVVPVRKRDGTQEQVKLLERVMPGLNFWRGRTI